MREQKIIIPLENIGTLTVSAIDYPSNENNRIEFNNGIILENINLTDEPDNKTPIQYLTTENIICLLEETEYQLLFESNKKVENIVMSPSIV